MAGTGSAKRLLGFARRRAWLFRRESSAEEFAAQIADFTAIPIEDNSDRARQRPVQRRGTGNKPGPGA